MVEQGKTCGIFRLAMVYSSTAGMAEGGAVTIYRVLAIYLYQDIIYRIASQHRTPPTDSGHGGALGTRYTTASHNIQQCTTNTGQPVHHQSFATPGCVYHVRVRACACILLYYYNIIILLYLYIHNNTIPILQYMVMWLYGYIIII